MIKYRRPRLLILSAIFLRRSGECPPESRDKMTARSEAQFKADFLDGKFFVAQ